LTTTLEGVEASVPDREVAVRDLADQLGLSSRKLALFEKVHGLRTLRMDPTVGLVDALLVPARQLLASVDPGTVRYLVYAHAIHEVAPALTNLPTVLRDELGLRHAEAFAITQQNCATGLGAVTIVGELLRQEAGAGRTALIVTGEKPFNPLIQVVPNTAIMGEATAACLVGVDGPGDRVLSYAARTLGEYSDLITLPLEETARLGMQYPQILAEVITEAVSAAGISLSDVDLVLPHNVNLLAWRNTIAVLGIPEQRVFLDNIARYSHCFASDVFVNHTTLRAAGRLRSDRHYVLAAVGAGATFSAAVITHRGER
jgi:3-oxoacyl-[acyl-carrier-protein] synthase III